VKKVETGLWALCANPDLYRIEDAVRNPRTDWWRCKRSDLKPGHRVIIWKCKGRHNQHRGVVAFGKVLTAPKPRPDDPTNPHWIDPSEGTKVEDRVEIQYVLLPKLPLWYEPESSSILGDLTVARGRGTVFHITEDQLTGIVDAAGGWPA
jgi:hypothetical protein